MSSATVVYLFLGLLCWYVVSGMQAERLVEADGTCIDHIRDTATLINQIQRTMCFCESDVLYKNIRINFYNTLKLSTESGSSFCY